MVFFPGLNNQPRLLVWVLVITLLFSITIFTLARRRRRSAVVAIILTTVWVILLVPDIWHYYAELRERIAPTEAIIEPLHRESWIRGYILVFMPVPFLLLGLRRPADTNHLTRR